MAGNKTAANDAESLGDLYRFFGFIAAALGLTFYLQLLKNRHQWIIMEMCLGAMALAMIPFAWSTMPFYLPDKNIDNLSVYLLRLMLLSKCAQTTSIFLCRDSRDPSVGIAVSISNVLNRGMLVFCALYGLLYHKTVSEVALRMDLVTVSFLMVGDLSHLSKLSTKDGSLTVGDPISLHLSIDAFITFLFGSLLLGFPNMFLELVNSDVTISEGHIGLTKVLATFILSGAVLSLASLSFKHTHDAVATLKSKLVFYIPGVLFGIYLYLFQNGFQGPGHTILLAGVLELLTFNAGYAVWRHEKTKAD